MNKYHSILIITLGTFILSLIGLYNGFPLVYSDTGTYIHSGFEYLIPFDRPAAYSMFIRFISLAFFSTWLVIAVQNLLTAFVIYEVLRIFFPADFRFMRIYLLIVFSLTIITGIGWYTNQLMPDFFAPLTLLIFFILLKRQHLLNLSGIMLAAIFIYAMIAHFSHLLIASAMIILVFAGRLIFSRWMPEVTVKRIVTVAVIIFLSWFILPGLHYKLEKRFILSKGTHVFLMAHLNDTGILKKFLDEHCVKPEFQDLRLCDHRDSLPVDLAAFMWSDEILEATGGWSDSEAEYRRIITRTLVKPRYLMLNVYRSVTYGLIQLTKFEIGMGLTPYGTGSPPYEQIHWRFGDEFSNFINSRQNKWDGIGLKLNTLNVLHKGLIIISVFLVLLLFTHPVRLKIDRESLLFLVFAIISIVMNAMLTAGLNAPCGRFQARVVWLLPLALIILVIRNFSTIRSIFKGEN